MTRVCFFGTSDSNVRADLLGYETARSALSPYDLAEPFENSLAIDTVSLGAAISLLNDLEWYLVRVTESVFVREPSVSDTEWLSWSLAEAVRSGEVDPSDTDTYLKIYGLESGSLVEPMYVKRREGEIPDYDLRDVSETVVLRVTPEEFSSTV
ncbi:MAG: DUF5804 family protein [Halodesulfurarchaeum sp.]